MSASFLPKSLPGIRCDPPGGAPKAGLPHTRSVSGRGFDAEAISATINQALTAAGLQTQSGPAPEVNATIQRAFATAGLNTRINAASQNGTAIAAVHNVRTQPAIGRASIARQPAASPHAGQFLDGSFTNAAGTRNYKLYIPASYGFASTEVAPLLVMLHGCTQSPDDFAVGTRMNTLAEQHGFLVVYPAQAANANGSRCWNWFRTEDQQRERGEPSIIAGITREVAAAYRVDAQRIFVAGLSAGAAMAIVLGATHPDLYAAVGAHSGLPYAAARDMPSAFAAMKSPNAQASAAVSTQPAGNQCRVPVIVFHGDRDQTVDASNSAAIIQQATRGVAGKPTPLASVHQGTTSTGQRYRRSVYLDAGGESVAEEWLLHGAAHAWSGGSAEGSFTNAAGVDASGEMIRFFLAQPRAMRN